LFHHQIKTHDPQLDPRMRLSRDFALSRLNLSSVGASLNSGDQPCAAEKHRLSGRKAGFSCWFLRGRRGRITRDKAAWARAAIYFLAYEKHLRALWAFASQRLTKEIRCRDH
jgi:hypothetical protein